MKGINSGNMLTEKKLESTASTSTWRALDDGETNALAVGNDGADSNKTPANIIKLGSR